MKKSFILVFLWAIASTSRGNNGSLDDGFLSEVTGDVLATVVQEDGKILIGGGFGSINGVERYRVARLNADGSLDLSFNAGAGDWQGEVRAFAVQPNRQIIVGGDFYRVNGVIKNGVMRLNPDGTLDESFSTGSGPAGGGVNSIAIQPDGRILIAGEFTKVNGTNRSRIARLHADGSLDVTFLNVGSGPNGTITSMQLQPDGKVFIGGAFTAIGGTPRNSIAKLKTDGNLDISFYPGDFPSGSSINSVAVSTSGQVLVGGGFQISLGFKSSLFNLARLNPDGGLDLAFQPFTDGQVYSIAVQQDSKIIFAGRFQTVSNVASTSLARLNVDGTLDTTFAPGLAPNPALLTVNSVSLQADARALIAGNFKSINGVTRVGIARLNADVFSPELDLSMRMFAGVSLTGVLRGKYRLEYAVDIKDPTAWTSLADVIMTNVPTLFIDTAPPGGARRFYRAVALP